MKIRAAVLVSAVSRILALCESKTFVSPVITVTKQRDPESGQQSLLFQVSYLHAVFPFSIQLALALLTCVSISEALPFLSALGSRQIDYPEIAEGIGPRHRFMSAYEQRIEPPDRRWQYLLIAAEPYETIAFKVPL